MINNALVSGVQSVISVSVCFQTLFPFRILQTIEQSSLCYRVDPGWFSILYIAVCICSDTVSSISTATVQTSCLFQVSHYPAENVLPLLPPIFSLPMRSPILFFKKGMILNVFLNFYFNIVDL